MEDPVLLSRLRTLSSSLDVVIQNLDDSQWQPKGPKDTRAEWLEEALWIGMEKTISKAIRAMQTELNKEIEKLLSPETKEASSAAWERYNHILRDSQSLLRECLEIIGTLAIRNKDLDQKILYVADELIRYCLKLTTGTLEYYLTVHGFEDTFTVAKAHIIRMRFPEWTIWDLPLIAHELGHVLIRIILAEERDRDLRYLMPFLKEQQEALMNMDTELKQNVDAERWAEGRIRKFMADAFATYTMGPAYACSAINLRFNPYVEAQRDAPSDAQRAHVVMSMLEWMNESVPLQTASHPKPYETVIGKLNEAWESTMNRSNSNCKIRAPDMEYVKSFTRHFASEVCHNSLMPGAMYPREGWVRAQEWCAEWIDQRENGKQLSLPQNLTGNLCDVLNATWLWRLFSDRRTEIVDRDLARVGQVGKDLCEEIIIKPPTGRGRIRSMTKRR
jgi:hypothetical protein